MARDARFLRADRQQTRLEVIDLEGLLPSDHRARIVVSFVEQLDLSALYDAIKNCGTSWWHYLDSTWLVDTSLSAQGVWDRLAPHVDKNDSFLVIGVTRNYTGWLTPEAWEWISSRVSKLAA